MDLFAPVKDQNDYGARNKKNVKVGTLSKNSYVPAGLSKAEYEKVRKAEADKKKANYERNVKKAGIFIDYTAWYKEPHRRLFGVFTYHAYGTALHPCPGECCAH